VVSEHWKEEPLARLRQYLIDTFSWSRDEEDQVLADCSRELDQAAEDYLATPEQPIEALFDYVYAELPADLQPQRAEALIQGDARA
jgi:pyruvate dehydrogenase E1 component alpha subunit